MGKFYSRKTLDLTESVFGELDFIMERVYNVNSWQGYLLRTVLITNCYEKEYPMPL